MQPPVKSGFIARLIFDPEDGGDTFLGNVGSHTGYTELYLGRWQHSKLKIILSFVGGQDDV
jgi:hypothetical protein